ncbi:MAG: tRNA uridine-5-carboxymethylaminomethyl(34) synthesis GTPase MnmE [Spirochaetes bacterium]|nr:tRNA uridine-5-carboxymethylaminomethyl(34) synthesis GTPase MnmE [Spirochaetota bacterium]
MPEKEYYQDIICARATPPGASAIAVIRVSGEKCLELLDQIFNGPKKGQASYQSHHAYYGAIIKEKLILDNVIILTFLDGSGFTGEESFEINCHGSEVIVSLIIQLLCEKGARLAEPGEFSQRAFLNGRIDLTEAEAVMDIVHSATKRSALLAVRQLSGMTRSAINLIKDKMANLLAEIEVYIDYPEEDLSLDVKKWIGKNNQIKEKLLSLLKGYQRGRLLREGIQAVILGKTNSGKSTLFNFLLNEDKAIVSDIHGTTRDYLDAVINIKGYGIRIYDTAGLRDTDDPIEKAGTQRATELSEKCDIVFYMIDGTAGFSGEDFENLQRLPPELPLLLIINKVDLLKKADPVVEKIEKQLKPVQRPYQVISMSAANKTGIEDFNSAFLDLAVLQGTHDSDDPVITNQRHADCIERALQNLKQCSIKLNEQILDLAAFELRESLNRVGEITGEITPEDIIQRIFSNFCVGK